MVALPLGEERRASDRRPRLLAAASRILAGDATAVHGGQLLLTGCGVAVFGSTLVILPGARGWFALGVVSLAMTAVLLATNLIDWTSLPNRATLLFPLSVAAALDTLSVLSPGLAAPLVGVFSLCFTYLGLFHRPSASLWFLPLAAGSFVLANGGLSPLITVRVVIAAIVWIMVAQVLAHLAARQQALTAALHSAAHSDVLTGLPNRRDLLTRLMQTRPGDAIVICDLDHFKAINDSLGHHAGDEVLADFGAMLRVGLRAEDYCARYGGEEFVVVLPNGGSNASLQVLHRLRDLWSTMRPGVTFSAGSALCRSDRAPAQTLAAADTALYRAKAAGRNTDRSEPDPQPAAGDAQTPRGTAVAAPVAASASSRS